MATANVRLDSQGHLRDEPEELLELEHPGGGRFNRLILIAFSVVAIVSGVVVALGVESSGSGQSALQKPTDDPGASARNNGEIADLAAHGGKAPAAPTFVPPPAVVASMQAPFQQAPPRPPSRYAQWAEEKYMKANRRRWFPRSTPAERWKSPAQMANRVRTSTPAIPKILP